MIEDSLKKFIVWVTDNVKYLLTAFKFDEEDIAKTGTTTPSLLGNLRNWARIYGFETFLLLLGIVILARSISPEKQKKKSHHGINKYGERY